MIYKWGIAACARQHKTFMKIILSGSIRIGKSTVIRHVMQRLRRQQPRGYLTCKEPGGLVIETWDGKKRICARRIEKAPRDGCPYKADLDIFNDFASAALSDGWETSPVVIDELGMLELHAARFTCSVAALFRGTTCVLAVIQQRALEQWLHIIRPEQVDHLFTVNIENRDVLPGRIADLL